jgi:hypothetical protein
MIGGVPARGQPPQPGSPVLIGCKPLRSVVMLALVPGGSLRTALRDSRLCEELNHRTFRSEPYRAISSLDDQESPHRQPVAEDWAHVYVPAGLLGDREHVTL